MPEKKDKPRRRISQDFDNMTNSYNEAEDESGSGGAAGGATEMRWKDPLSGATRDDLLSPQEKKRLLQVHEFATKILIDKQKHTIEQRKLLKEGVRQVAQQKQGKGLGSGKGGLSTRYKEHPIAKKFAGKIDEKLSPLANENKSETNEDIKNENDLKNELKNQLKNQNRLQYSNTPKLRPPGT